MDVTITLNLINSRDHQALMLFYAQIVGDYHRVVSMFMSQERYTDAIAVLTDAPIEKVLTLIYKTAPVLIQKEPDATVNMLLSKPQLSLSGLLPALLSYCSALDLQIAHRHRMQSSHHKSGSPRSQSKSVHGSPRRIRTGSFSEAVPLDRDFEGNEINFAILYLKQTLSRQGFSFGAEPSGVCTVPEEYAYGSPEAACFHTLVWLLAKYDALENQQEEEELVALLTVMQESRVHDTVLSALDVDYEYILRQCRQYKRRRAAVRALMLLDCPVEAVDEAIALDLEEAKQLVLQLQQLGEGESELLKQLWMEVAKAVIAKETDMSIPIALIKESQGVLSIDVSSIFMPIVSLFVTPHIYLFLRFPQDLLPHLPNFTEIELFQEEICQTLQSCGDSIQYLKDQMRELADSAESTVQVGFL